MLLGDSMPRSFGLGTELATCGHRRSEPDRAHIFCNATEGLSIHVVEEKGIDESYGPCNSLYNNLIFARGDNLASHKLQKEKTQMLDHVKKLVKRHLPAVLLLGSSHTN
jgi:hypothetical protein